MARVPYCEEQDLPEAHRDLYRQIRQRQPKVTNLARALAHVPQILQDRFVYSGSLRKNTILDPRIRELAILVVGKEADAPYEVHHHTEAGLQAGLTQDQVDAIEDFETSPLFDDFQRLVMRFALELTRDIECTDATWSALSERMSVAELVELTLLVGWYNQTVRVLRTLRIDIEH